jgi:hypothetical protein
VQYILDSSIWSSLVISCIKVSCWVLYLPAFSAILNINKLTFDVFSFSFVPLVLRQTVISYGQWQRSVLVPQNILILKSSQNSKEKSILYWQNLNNLCWRQFLLSGNSMITMLRLRSRLPARFCRSSMAQDKLCMDLSLIVPRYKYIWLITT